MGQLLAELLYQWMLIISGVLAFVAGFFSQSFQLTVNIVGAGALLTCAVCLFDWPFYNKHPINFTASKRGKLSVVRE